MMMRHPFELEAAELEILNLSFEEGDRDSEVLGGTKATIFTPVDGRKCGTYAAYEIGGCLPITYPPKPIPFPKPVHPPVHPPSMTTEAYFEEGGCG